MKPKAIMDAIRYVLAVIILVFSLNGFFQFLPMPQPPVAAGEFLKALGEAQYVFPLLYVGELIIGIFLLSKKWAPFALLFFIPVALNILLYHLFLDPLGGWVGYLTFILTILLFFYYLSRYRKMLS